MNGPAKLIAGIIALTGFVIAAVAGLAAGNAAETTLLRCIIAMFVCYFAGLPLGMVCEHVIEEHVKAYIAKNPMPKRVSEEVTVVDEVEPAANVEGNEIVV